MCGSTAPRNLSAQSAVSQLPGTRATISQVPGLAEAQPLTHIEALELDEIPGHLLVIGGGYVGIELAQAIRRFGSKVSVIDVNERLMQWEDEDVCEALHSLLEDEGINVVLNAHSRTRIGEVGAVGQDRCGAEGSREDAGRKSCADCRGAHGEH